VADALMVDEGLWEVFEPLLPEPSPRRTGRERVGDRAAFTAIVFVLLTGVPWRMMPKEIGCSRQTAWRRLRDWQATGVWERLQRELLRRRDPPGRTARSHGIVDSGHIRAQGSRDPALAGSALARLAPSG
jgi:transposase